MTGYASIDKPWLKYYSEEAIKNDIPKCSAYEIIYKNNQDNLSRIAIDYYGNKFTYRQFFDYVDSVAGSLVKLGIMQGDIVTICMLNSVETVFLFYALNKIGAVANLICGLDSEKELIAHIANVKSHVIFTLDIFVDKLVSIINKTELKRIVVSDMSQSMPAVTRFAARYIKKMMPKTLPHDDRIISWKKFMAQNEIIQSINVETEAPAMICYTGGTTGGSKGVVLSNRSIIAVAQQYIWRGVPLSRESRWAQVLPLFIAYGVTCSLQIPLMVGMTVQMKIVGSESIRQLCKMKPQYIIYGPAAWENFADENCNMDLSFLKEGISGGDKITTPVEEKINHYLLSHGSELPILNGYGMTEVGAAVSVNFSGAYKAGSVGIPFVKNIISAFDVETGEELTYGREGEICINTPSMMTEYINNAEETANIIRKHKDGSCWIHSGDLGFISEDGFVYIIGRLKRYILSKYNGLYKKVFSLDIEKVLLSNSLVNNCAVVPIRDEEREQVPCAYIILKKGVELTEEVKREIAAYCEENLDKVYIPSRYCFVESFPLTKIGKVDYLALENYMQGDNCFILK